MNKQELLDFICECLNLEKCSNMILNQIHRYVTERGYTYIEIARALSYYIDVEGNVPEQKYGIGIVPVIMDDARKYFAELERKRDQQLKAAEESKRRQSNNGNVVIVCHLADQKPKNNKRKINIGDL